MTEMQRVLAEINARPLNAPDFVQGSFFHKKNRPKKKRTARSTNVGPTTKKGENQPPPKDGGNGTSKDAIKRREKRTRREGRYQH